MTPDRWLRVWFADDSYTYIIEDDLPRIDALVSQHIDSGGTRDALVQMTDIYGSACVARASYIVGWSLTTPEVRQAEWHHESARRDEKREMKQAAGLPWDEDE